MSIFKSIGTIFGDALSFGAYSQSRAMRDQARLQRDAVKQANEENRKAKLLQEAERTVSAQNEDIAQKKLDDMNVLAFEFGEGVKDENILSSSTSVPRGTLANLLS